MRSRREIIREALKIQIEANGFVVDMFTSEDVLAVANIGKREVEKLKKDFNSSIDSRIDEFLEGMGII